MDNKETIQEEKPTQVSVARMSSGVAAKKAENKKNRIRNIIANTVVLILLIAGFYWLVREYFHVGDKDYTEAAQVEEFINPVNTRVAGYIKEIRFIEHQHVKKRRYTSCSGRQRDTNATGAGRSGLSECNGTKNSNKFFCKHRIE